MSTSGTIHERIRSLPDEYFQTRGNGVGTANAEPVETRRDLSYDEFVNAYVRKKRPVVIKDGVLKNSITPEVLLADSGHRSLTELAGGGGSRFLVRGRASSIEKFNAMATLGDYLGRFAADDADLPYLTNLCVSVNFPGLAQAFASPRYFQPNWSSRWPFSAFAFEQSARVGTEVFISPAGGTYGVLHYDRHAQFLGVCQYFGKKVWWLCSPEYTRYLYPVPGGYPFVSPINPLDPDLDKFPEFVRVRPFVVTLEAGDILFVPSLWWHMTRAVTANISTLHRVINRHNVMSYLWDLRQYLKNDRRVLLGAVKQLIVRR
jgi:Cupin-like domain